MEQNVENLDLITKSLASLEFDPNNKPNIPSSSPTIESPTTAVHEIQEQFSAHEAKAKMDAEAVLKGKVTGLGPDGNQNPLADMVAVWMAQGTPYHGMVLQHYMSLLTPSFEALPLELAFRVLCSKLLLRGETQQVNRVLSAFAKTYHQVRRATPPCLAQPDHLLLASLEPLEITVTSMVMLNTILHNPTAREAMNATGHAWKRQWIRSTAEALGPQREWEQYLDQLYNSIEMHPIRLPDSDPPGPAPSRPAIARSDSRSSRSSIYTSASVSSKSSLMSQAKKWGMGVLGQARSAPQVQVPNFPSSNTQVLMSGILIKKNYTAPDGSKAKNRNWVKYWCNVWLETGQGSVLEPGRLELHMHRIVEGRPSEKEMDKLMNLTDVVQSHDEWEPVHDSESPTTSGYMEMASGLKKSPSTESTMSTMKRKPPRPVTLPPLSNTSSKWIYKQPEVLPLLHSLATALPGAGYSATRPHVFSLLLFDGSTTLFQVSTASMLQDWVTQLNKTVAMRSKRVLRGGVTNVEYGWNHLVPQDSEWDASSLKLLPKDVVGRWRIGVWQQPELAHVVGLQTMDKQIQDMKSQIDAVEKELSIHTPLRVTLEKQFQGTSNLNVVLQNWTKKNHSLAMEYRKYCQYLDTLVA